MAGYNPGDLMEQVAQQLTARGFSIRYPEEEPDRQLIMTGPDGSRSEITVGESGYVLWECPPKTPGEANPRKIADAVSSLLTGRVENCRYLGDAYGREGIPFKGIVGRELAARGLRVTLEIYEQPEYYYVDTSIAVAKPGTNKNAQAWIDDNGYLIWECDFFSEAATTTSEPGHLSQISDPATLAGSIAAAIISAATIMQRDDQPSSSRTPPPAIRGRMNDTGINEAL